LMISCVSFPLRSFSLRFPRTSADRCPLSDVAFEINIAFAGNVLRSHSFFIVTSVYFKLTFDKSSIIDWSMNVRHERNSNSRPRTPPQFLYAGKPRFNTRLSP
jgi:hypothetical protein